MHRTALLSPCGTFRYRLGRRWSDGPTVAFVLLNPSTADEVVDDPTVRRCIRFSERDGYGGLEVVNLYAYVATDPADLRRAGCTLWGPATGNGALAPRGIVEQADALIELLLTGQREAAADFMRLHLRDAAREKAGGTLAMERVAQDD
jgi:hypothetical protein